MTRVAKFMLAAAATTMSVAPAMAAPAPAPTSSSVRAAADVEDASDLRGGDSYGIFIALAAGIAIIVAIIILGGDEADLPTSP